MTLFALLEMHKRGEATWEQKEIFGPIDGIEAAHDATHAASSGSSRRCSSSRRSRSSTAELAEACEVTEAEIDRALDLLGAALAERGRRPARGRRRLRARRRTRTPRRRRRRLLAKPKTPPLTQAQAETLAIVAYLQPVSRPEIARIRGVSSESAVQTLTERGLIEESGRSRFGAVIYRTTRSSSASSASPGSTSCPTPPASTRRPRTRPSCASGC